MAIRLKDEQLIVEQKASIYLVKIKDILFIERKNNSSYIRTIHKDIEIRNSLIELERLLPCYFLRVHRSFIINKDWLSELKIVNNKTYEVVFSKDKTALASREIINEIIF
ncbi:MAG: LytTR family DNA-binding domain-containing protein [Anaerobacillus sp.]